MDMLIMTMYPIDTTKFFSAIKKKETMKFAQKDRTEKYIQWNNKTQKRKCEFSQMTLLFSNFYVSCLFGSQWLKKQKNEKRATRGGKGG